MNEKLSNEEALRVTGLTYVGGGETTEDLEEIEGDQDEGNSIQNIHSKNREFIIKKIQKNPSNLILNTANIQN